MSAKVRLDSVLGMSKESLKASTIPHANVPVVISNDHDQSIEMIDTKHEKAPMTMIPTTKMLNFLLNV